MPGAFSAGGNAIVCLSMMLCNFDRSVFQSALSASSSSTRRRRKLIFLLEELRFKGEILCDFGCDFLRFFSGTRSVPCPVPLGLASTRDKIYQPEPSLISMFVCLYSIRRELIGHPFAGFAVEPSRFRYAYPATICFHK